MASASTTRDQLPLGKGVFGGIATLSVALISPSLAAMATFLLLGWIMVRSALNHRQTGWVSGLLFGSMLLLVPVSGWLYALFILSTQ